MCIGPRENVVMPMDWQPRPIIKSREVKPQEYEKNQLELMILRDEVDRDWDDIDNEIWVKEPRKIHFQFHCLSCPPFT